MADLELHLVESPPLPYLLSTGGPATSEPRPVLCFLHGYDEAAPLQIERALTRHGPLRPGNGEVVQEFVVVAPQLPVAGDLWPRYAGEVVQIVGQVLGLHQGDPARVYLTGFSFGGNGVFDLALRQPELWAALWPVDPTRVPSRDPGLPTWLSSGEVSRRRRAEFMEVLGLEMLRDDLAGDRMYEDRGLDHVGTAAHAYQDERVYRWLLSRQRRAPGFA